MPGWVKASIDEWLQAANLSAGKLFRRVNKNGSAWGDGVTKKAVWHVVREYAHKAGIDRLAPHDLRRTESRAVRGFAYATEAGMLSSIAVPEPDRLHTASSPPASLARSCIPGRP